MTFSSIRGEERTAGIEKKNHECYTGACENE